MATEYVVLAFDEGREGWLVQKNVEAASPKAAIRAMLNDSTQAGGEFVAVPARSWQPVKVQVETALKFS